MTEGTILDEISKTHDWDRSNELWVCKKCKLTPIGAHIWGDAEWTATAKKCLGMRGVKWNIKKK